MKNDFAHQLVHSLTKSEKRYFKLFSQLQPGTKNYLLLFDALESMQQYDAKVIKAKLKDTKMNLSYERAYLKRMIMRSLRNYQNESSSLFIRMGSMMLDAEILFEKRFFAEAKELLDEVMVIARDNWKVPYLPLLYNRKGAVMRFSYYQDMSEKDILKWETDYRGILSLHSMMAEFELMHSKMQQKYKKRNLTAQDAVEMEEIMSHPLMKKDPESLPFYPHIVYLLIKGTYKQITGANFYPESIRQAELWLAEKEAQRNLPMEYIAALHNAGIGYAGIGRIDKMKEMMGLLEQAIMHNADQEHEKELYLLMLQFRLFDANGIPGEPSAWLNDNITRLEIMINKVNTYERHLFLYYIGSFYMLDGNPGRALDYLNRITESEEGEPFIFFGYSLMLTLAAHYDLGNYMLLPHLVRSVKRTLMRLDKFSDLEKAIMAGFNKLANTKSGDDADKEMVAFLKRISSVKYEKNEYYKGVADGMNIWLKSKVEKRPMIVVAAQFYSGKN